MSAVQQLELFAPEPVPVERPRLARPRLRRSASVSTMPARRPRLNRQTRGERNIAWCERYLKIPEGKFFNQPLVMAEFMKEDFRAIYDNPHGTRRAIISRARKN